MNKMHIYYNGKLDKTIWCGIESNWKANALKEAQDLGFTFGKEYTFEFE